MSLQRVNQQTTSCNACPRLRKYCQSVAKIKRRAYAHEDYWGKPITGFGDPSARFIIVGLAPAAHGANRTGRIFTGDRSGQWLYRALYRAGFANQPTYERRDDGLRLSRAYVTCVVKCAPPGNKPLPRELAKCGKLLQRELDEFDPPRVWLVLGQIALNGLWPFLRDRYELAMKKPKFGHGHEVSIPSFGAEPMTLLMSYHPSQQNTFTGRLTERMFDQVFARARELLR